MKIRSCAICAFAVLIGGICIRILFVMSVLAAADRLRALGANVGDVRFTELLAPSLWSRGGQLRIKECVVNEAVATDIARMPWIDAIYIDRCTISSRSVALICERPGLRHLSLVRATGLSDLTCVPWPKGLETLDMTGSDVGDSISGSIEVLPVLRVVRLGETLVTDKTVSAIVLARGVLEIDVHGTSITDAAVSGIPSDSRIVYVNISDTRVSDAACGALLKLHHLEEIDVRRTAVGSAGIDQLSRLASIRWMAVSPDLDEKVIMGVRSRGIRVHVGEK